MTSEIEGPARAARRLAVGVSGTPDARDSAAASAGSDLSETVSRAPGALSFMGGGETLDRSSARRGASTR
ncbi:MAG TPA: hypothetical protein QGF05_03745, partial [Dehalococcoidia bacterium]|nr:hypothetical protein [Dehalococcoidia bacterium]